MKYFLLVFSVGLFIPTYAQKKLIPVVQSALTGVVLPVGSTQDKRLLMELSATSLLEMESKKANAKIKTTEVLYLPSVAASGFNADSLINQILALGWNITAIESDLKYVWLQKENRSVITYLSMDKKVTNLYFGETDGPPNLAIEVNQNQGMQNTDMSNQQQQNNTQQNNAQQNQQQTDPQQQAQQPVSAVQNTNNQHTNTVVEQQPGIPPNSPAATSAGKNGIVTTTTNFDDGWTATPNEEWVELRKNDITVLLHYPMALPDNLKGDDGGAILDYFWNILVAPRYTADNFKKRPFSSGEYTRINYMEAAGTDKISGQSFHIAFRIFINSGIASCVEITAPSKINYDAMFPDVEQTTPLPNYNKFALSAADISGLWKETAGGFGQYYNVYNGNYAGMNAVSVNSQLTLTEQGSFTFETKGASGMVGNQQFFKEKNEGNYVVGHWEINTTSQQGKIENYNAFYQAVKKGRILHLQNKQYSSQVYHLIKAN